MASTPGIPVRLQAIIDDFALSEGREKLELLIQYAENIPPLPEYLVQHLDKMDNVEECMTPVFVKAEMVNGGMHFYFDVPPESPTVRGFAAMMSEGLDGSQSEEILAIPNDFFNQMGLEKILSMQRLNGLSAILAHMKRLAAQTLQA